MKASTVNRTIGGRFEEELCEILASNGWWAHNLAQNQVGQPADVIAVKRDIAVLIDCKVCANDRFTLSRIEGNQEGAMTLWKTRGNCFCYFAMKMTDGTIHMVHFDELKQLEDQGVKSIADFTYYRTLEEWVERMERQI